MGNYLRKQHDDSESTLVSSGTVDSTDMQVGGTGTGLSASIGLVPAEHPCNQSEVVPPEPTTERERLIDPDKTPVPPAQEQQCTEGVTINTYWKNLPPINIPVYWAYSSRNDPDTLYFMSADDCNILEQAYQEGKPSCHINHGDNVYVNFRDMRQYTGCGEAHRYVRRITSEQYQELKSAYLNDITSRAHYWCLNCRAGYILFSPKFQDIIDNAHNIGKNIKISLNRCYSYTIDPFCGTQQNNSTGKIRPIARIKQGCNTKVVYGSYLTKIPVPPAKEHENEHEHEHDDVESMVEQSCIYSAPVVPTHSPKSKGLDTDRLLDESCIYSSTV